MIIGSKSQQTISSRHQRAIDYAVSQIRKSELSRYVTALYLYGSCARRTADWFSDVDMLLEFSPDLPLTFKNKREIARLRNAAVSDNIHDPELDLKCVIGSLWKESSDLYYQNVRKDGINIWD